MLISSSDRYLERAKAALQDYDEDELEAPEGECPNCGDRAFPENPTYFTLLITLYYSPRWRQWSSASLRARSMF